MNMDPQEAREQLALIEETQAAEKLANSSGTGWFLIIWGLVWLAGFMISHFAAGRWLLWVWLLLIATGSALSAIIGVRLNRQVQYVETGPKLGLFYPTLFAFAVLWLFLAQPASWEQTAVLAVTILGFASAASGILLSVRSLIVAGAGLALAATAVYLLLPALFGLIMGLAGGGGMVISGLIISQRGYGRG